MDFFDVLNLVGGLSLFLFGMNVMGDALEKSAGDKLRVILNKLTTGKIAGLLTGIGITAVIQSSSATTVMVVGFVNSGLMSLKQAINVIMGANIGTTVTAWILSLAGISSDNIFMQLLKPTSFTPVLALIGCVLYLFSKKPRKKDIGLILLGFATLMFGMDTMTGAVSGLSDVPKFREIFTLFTNPVMGVLAGAIVTGIIQSSSASVGILQALATTGQVTYGAAIPIIMGQNIGTCVTALLSSVGTTRNARRAALVHLSFNVIGTIVGLTIFCAVRALVAPALLGESASLVGIAVCHSTFNILCVSLLLPMSDILEKLVMHIVPDDKQDETQSELDERLFATPAIALERACEVTSEMAEISVNALYESLSLLGNYRADIAEHVREEESTADNYEDILSTYLVKLSTLSITAENSAEAAKLLKIIGDFERISDHAVNIVESAEEMNGKELDFSDEAKAEIGKLINAVKDIAAKTMQMLNEESGVKPLKDGGEAITDIEALEEVIDGLKEQLRTNHIIRMQQGKCSIELGFVWSDLLTNLERVSDHCSNIAGCIRDVHSGDMGLHTMLGDVENSDEFRRSVNEYAQKYSIA